MIWLIRAGLADNELVFRRAAREPAGVDNETAGVGQNAFAAVERGRVELRRARIAEDAAAGAQAVSGESLLWQVGDRHGIRS